MIVRHRRAVLVFAVFIALSGAAAYRYPGRLQETPFAGPASTVAPLFLDRTLDFRITVSHRQGDERLTGLDETLGPGACTLDYDGDGWIDLFIVNGAGDTRYYGHRHWWQSAAGHRLMHNVGGHHFVDVTAQAGLGIVSHGQGCVAADFNNDGKTDLFITNIGQNILLRNNGNSTFTDVSRGSGIEDDGWHTAAAVADVDGDGKLDLYVGGFIAFDKAARTFEPSSQFKQDLSPLFNSALYPALPNRLLRNLGDFHFEDRTQDSGLAESDGRTLAALWLDANDDGRPDLMVANATGTGSTSGFINRGNWQFEPMGIRSQIESGLSVRGLALADLDNDGRAEIIQTGASGNHTALLATIGEQASAPPKYVDIGRQWRLVDERYAAFSPWSPALGDFNNDGWTDLMVVNGQVAPDADAPHVTVGQAKQLWLNDGHAGFIEHQPPPRSALLDRQSARGMTLADFNNDGRLDAYVAHNNDLGQLLVNAGPAHGHWLGLRLEDTRGNRDAVGARVAVTTKQGSQVHWITKGMGFLSDGDPRVHFGLGSATQADIAIRWADGAITRQRAVAVDTYMTVSRADGLQSVATTAVADQITIPTAPQALSPAARAAYYDRLLRVDDADAFDAAATTLLHENDAEVRRRLAAALAGSRSADRLRLLVRLLEDRDAATVAQTVDVLCGYESEDTLRYLLRMFSHGAAVVRRHTAECFTRYYADFRDQQVVIQRKYLALPYLIALLSDGDREVRLSAVRALGHAEKFRGVMPLIELLGDADEELRGEAVHALGLIRERDALRALRVRLGTSGNSPKLYAQLFIALKRLDDSALEASLRDFASGRGAFTAINAADRLRTVQALLELPDGVVFSHATIQTLVAASYAQNQTGTATQVSYLRVVEKAGLSETLNTVTALLNNAHASVRAAAYLACMTLAPERRKALVEAALRDPDSDVRNAMLERAAAGGIELSVLQLTAALTQTDTRTAAFKALGKTVADPLIKRLMAWVEDGTLDEAQRHAALAALCRAHRPPTPSTQWYSAATDSLIIAMLECEFAQLPPLHVAPEAPAFLNRYLEADSFAVRAATFDGLLARQELWAKRAVVTLLGDREQQPLRKHVMRALPAEYLDDGGVLRSIAGTREDPLRFDALLRLGDARERAAYDTLEAIAHNIDDDAAARALAHALLTQAKPASSAVRD